MFSDINGNCHTFMTILEVEEVRVAEYPSNDIVMAVVNRTRKLHSFGVNEKRTN